VQKGGANDPTAVYDFTYTMIPTQIICLGDLEGAFPFAETFNNLDHPGKSHFPKVLRNNMNPLTLNIQLPTNNNVFNLSRDNKTIQIYTDADNKVVFSGDLVDHGKYDIRWLQAMSSSDANVLCTMGNRELNKIRMIDEFFICKEDRQLPWLKGDGSKWASLHDLVDDVVKNWSNDGPTADKYGFKYDWNHFQERFTNWLSAEWGGIYNSKSMESRVLTALGKSWGIGESEAMFNNNLESWRTQELIDLGVIEKIPADNKVLYQQVLYCITNMIMGVEWTGKNESWIPDDCKFLNGLYIKQIRKAHMIAQFKYGTEGKFAMVSHSKMHYTQQEIDKENAAEKKSVPAFPEMPVYITDNFEKDTESTAVAELATILRTIETDKIAFCDSFNDLWNTKANESGHPYADEDADNWMNYDTFLKYIEISAVVNPDKRKVRTPIVNNSFRPDTVGGGNSIKFDDIPYDLHIHGHAPVGVVPYVYQETVSGKDKTHVNLDISVVGAPSQNQFLNTGAYAYLKIDGNGELKIVGYLSPPNNNYNNTPNVEYPQYHPDPYLYNETPQGFIAKMQSKMTKKAFAIGFKFQASASAQALGGKKSTKPTKTSEKVVIGKRERTVYKLGRRKFVRVKGTLVPLTEARKSLCKA